MKQYIITIIGASILSGIANILSPPDWVKYVKIMTGLVILSVIIAPVSSISGVDLFSDFTIEETMPDENVYINTIKAELEKRIEADIKMRIKNEFFKDADADVTISLNENNEIEGVKHITIACDADADILKNRMCEVYGTPKNEVEIYEY